VRRLSLSELPFDRTGPLFSERTQRIPARQSQQKETPSEKLLDKTTRISRRLESPIHTRGLTRKSHNKLEKMVRWKRSKALAPGASAPGNEVAIVAVKHEEDVEWDAMFEHLKTFKNVEGHCHAERATSDPALRQWGESSRVVS
jgi:hypothetical protein